MQSRKRQVAERIELQIKENYKYIEVLEEDIIKQAEI